MAAAEKDKRAQIIIKKKIMGGHAGHHGGAWKVAYADFVTAMMAFFMVLWLMGADEETKQSVQQYFTEGATPGGADTINRNGAFGGGDGSIRGDGAQGRFSEEWIRRPTSTAPVYVEEQTTLSNLPRFEGSAFSADTSTDLKVMFKIPGAIKFPVNSHTVPTVAYDYLRSIASTLREHDGTVVIEGRGDNADDWSLAFVRATAVRNILIKDYAINADKLIPMAAYETGGNGRVIASGESKRGQTTFTLKRTREP